MLPQEGERIRFRFARVNDDGQSSLLGQVELTEEDVALHRPRRVIVMIVEPDLSPGDDPRMSGQLQQPSLQVRRVRLRIVRMDAERHVDPRIGISQGERHLAPGLRSAHGDVQDHGDAAGASSREHVRPIRIEFRSAHMRV
jgi:hypothetical protein